MNIEQPILLFNTRLVDIILNLWQFLTNIIEYAEFYDIAMSQNPTLGTLK